MEAKRGGDEVCEGGFGESALLAGVEDPCVRKRELEDGLAAGSAGHRRCVVEIGDGDGLDADRRAVEADGGGDGGLFGAGGEAEAGVFHVGAGDDVRGAIFADGDQQRSADAEVAVGRVRVLGGRCGAGAEDFNLGSGEAAGVWS